MSSGDSLDSLGKQIDTYVGESSSEPIEEASMREWARQEFFEEGPVTVLSSQVPMLAIPIRSIAAVEESSGPVSTSEPTNILTKNPASRMTESLLMELRCKYRFPKSMELRVPMPTERIDYKVDGWIGFYVRPFTDGLRFPIPRLAWEVLDHYGIAPSQLMPNAWRILLSIECLSFEKGLFFEVKDIIYSYYLKEHLTEKGRYTLYLRRKRDQLIMGLPTNDRGNWQSDYFFVKNEGIFGSTGMGRVSEYWSVISPFKNRSFDRTPTILSNTQALATLPVEERDWRIILVERRLRKTLLWKEIFESEGISTPLALCNQVLEVVYSTWSIDILYGGVFFIKPLTPREILCAEDIMSRPVKVASIDELMNRKKARKLKMKEPQESVPELPQPQSTEIQPIKEKSTEIVAKSGKRKAAEIEDDFENITVKIPTGSTAISDPSSLNPFIKDLLLEEDDRRLTQIGAVEAMKKAAALNYQAMECSLFMQRQAELMVKKQKDMEKSIGIMRKEIVEMKTSFEKKNQENMELSKELVEAKATLKMEKEISDVMIENYKAAFDNIKKENSALVEQIESIALESMLKERNDLMKDFIEGRTGSWEPQKWIQEYEHYISSTNEEGVEGKGEEVESRKAEEESKESEMLIGPESEERATEVAEEEVEGQGKEKEDAGRMEIVAAGPVQDVPASDVV